MDNKMKRIKCFGGIEKADIPILMAFLASPRPVRWTTTSDEHALECRTIPNGAKIVGCHKKGKKNHVLIWLFTIILKNYFLLLIAIQNYIKSATHYIFNISDHNYKPDSIGTQIKC
jgi:hypothetical protein